MIAARLCAAVGLLVAAACAPTAPQRPWEAHVGEGALPVHGARWNDPGPRIYRALAVDPGARATLGTKAEPDTLSVVCRRDGGARVVLTYARARPVVVEPTGALVDGCGGVRPARAAVPLRRVEVARRGDGSPVPPVPTARERLECPIDPTRAACRSFCAGSSAYEWCR